MSTATPLVAGFEEDRPSIDAAATAVQPDDRDVPLGRHAAAIPLPLCRSTVGAARLAARDEWNAQELRISEAFARGVRHDSQVMDEVRFRVLVTAMIGHAPSDVEFKRIMRMTDRDLDGQVDFEECHYGLRCWHGYHCISSDSLRSFAELHFGGLEGIDTGKLSALMQDLNGGLSVDSTEVDMVVSEAEFLSCGRARRPDLLRAVGAWYANVVRKPTPWGKLFATGACRYLPAVEYHTAVLAWVAYANDNLLLSLPGGASTRTATCQSQSRASGSGSVAHVCYMWLILAIYAASFLALVFPSAFFAWLIYVGSEHGSDACPKDLDGLLVWYGALGLATTVVSCADTSASSTIVLVLGVALLLLPWLGTSWTMHLNWVDRQACGQFLSDVSVWLWVLLTFLELVLALLAAVGVFVNVRLERKLVSDAKM